MTRVLIDMGLLVAFLTCSSQPGELLNQDAFYLGRVKGVGKIFVQVVVDTFCSLAFAKVRLGYLLCCPFSPYLRAPERFVLTPKQL